MSIGPGVARPARATSLASTPASSISLRTTCPMRRQASSAPLSCSVRHRVIRERSARVVHQPELDVRAADIDADKERLLRGRHRLSIVEGMDGMALSVTHAEARSRGEDSMSNVEHREQFRIAFEYKRGMHSA